MLSRHTLYMYKPADNEVTLNLNLTWQAAKVKRRSALF